MYMIHIHRLLPYGCVRRWPHAASQEIVKPSLSLSLSLSIYIYIYIYTCIHMYLCIYIYIHVIIC